jgi:hypothetical protein
MLARACGTGRIRSRMRTGTAIVVAALLVVIVLAAALQLLLSR